MKGSNIHSLLSIIRILFLGSSDNSWWTFLLLWVVRITTFSLLLRTYIFPWSLSLISSHIRVRSISLRSIRGLFIRKGARTWRADRIGFAYRWSAAEGSSRFSVRIEGVHVDIGREKQTFHKRSRRLTLSDFAPSPMARRMWILLSDVYSFVDPLLRPLIRITVVLLLRVMIRSLPTVTQAVDFYLDSAVVRFETLPGTEVVIEEASLHTKLGFTQLEPISLPDEKERELPARRSKHTFGMSAWRSRLSGSLRRSWERAWGKTHSTASVSFKFTNVRGYTPSRHTHGQRVTFLELLGPVDVSASMGFSPKTGTIDVHSLETTLVMGEFNAALDTINALLQSLKGDQTAPLRSPVTHLPKSGARTSSPFPPSVRLPISLTPNSPNSIYTSLPIMDVLSSPLRSGHYLDRPPLNLRRPQPTSWLSVLKAGSVQISTIKLTNQAGNTDLGGEIYEAIIRGVIFSACLSDPAQNQLHREWLGRSAKIDPLEPSAYSFNFAVKGMNLVRKGNLLPLVTLGSVDLQALVTQWPSPWAPCTPLIPGDPNAALFVIRIQMATIEITEQLESLQRLISEVDSINKSEFNSPALPEVLYPVPRVVFDLHCNRISAQIICANSDAGPLAVELRTDGLYISSTSHFSSQPLRARTGVTDVIPDRLPVQMNVKISLLLNPTSVRVGSSWLARGGDKRSPAHSVSDMDFLDNPALLSLETIELKGDGTILGDVDDDTEHAVSLNRSSAVFDLHCSSDALSIELWHATVLTAVLKLMSLSPNNPQEHPHARLLDRLPSGLSFTLSITRVVLFITAPDINPADDSDFSRGFAVRAGVSLQYSSLDARHVYRYRSYSAHSQIRHKLYLPEERVVESLAAAKASYITQEASAFFKASVSDLVLRSAIATLYAADDPFILERDDPTLQNRECLRIDRIKVELNLSGKHESTLSSMNDICGVTVHVSHLHGTFQLIHVYSILLALRTFSSLLQARPSRPIPRIKPSNNITIQFQGTVKTIQIYWVLVKQKVISRIDTVTVYFSPDGPFRIRWNTALLWVLLPSRITKWEDDKADRWEELGHMHQWNVFLPPYPTEPKSIAVEGDSFRFRIPFGFVLADLIFDLSVTFKSLRHLSQIITDGRFAEMPCPEAENAKAIPKLTLRVRCLSMEAADDPFESKLALVFRAGPDATSNRLSREDAFAVKVATILAATTPMTSTVPLPEEHVSEYQFGSQHSVSIQDARERLDQVHAADWRFRHKSEKDKRFTAEEAILQKLRGGYAMRDSQKDIPNLVNVSPAEIVPPLFRAMLNDLTLSITPPSFPRATLPDFLFDQGNGLPRNSQFSLLIPMHINFTLSSLRVDLRNYPLPLLNIAPHTNTNLPVWVFDTDFVIAEEMGSDLSVDWVRCDIVEPNAGVYDSPFAIFVPKTIMPVKTYANPVIQVTTDGVTAFSWGVSYGPATQDLMRILDSLTSTPRDTSPSVGFWDKMRLVFHWSIQVSFLSDVQLYMKGSRDPYCTDIDGAGFVLSWRGNPRILIGQKNDDMELIQVISDSMFIAIPNFEHIPGNKSPPRRDFRKICAKFSSGVRFGVGFVMERSCDPDCDNCHGPAFYRKCRFFDFRAHYEVKFEKKGQIPVLNSPQDSYNGFRSDFIHLSLSLSSGICRSTPEALPDFSSIHLTPKTFAHFWSWWELFDSALSLPTRQGTYYPPRVLSPKLGRHIATLKYRILVTRLFIMHAYIDESRETWVDGVTPLVGVKAMIDQFQADLHQRDQETIAPGTSPNVFKIIRHKPFYAAEVGLKGLDLRAVMATFKEPLKQDVLMTAPPQRSNYRTRNDLPQIELESMWIDLDDFVETDWSSLSTPVVHLLPVAECPHFTYFKRNSTGPGDQTERSKFGDEFTHTCLLGKGASVPQIQVAIALARVEELRQALLNLSHTENTPIDSTNSLSDHTNSENLTDDRATLENMIELLQDYISLLRKADMASGADNPQSYRMPSDTVSPDEWVAFDNVYQIHCPKIFMNSAIRDILMQYYYCSRTRRGFEYHMATRAVKFIRDQAKAAIDIQAKEQGVFRGPSNSAHAAALALRKILIGDNTRTSAEVSEESSENHQIVDPLYGWSDGVSLQKSHFFLLLKPQIVLRNEESVCILAAVQAKLQSFAIIDESNFEDPISGKVMSRSYASLTGLQSFCPTNPTLDGDGCVPLEVLIDFRCESSRFDRLVPQTDATFRYDKFNRLRLRNSITSVAKISHEKTAFGNVDHLQNQTDLIQVQIPRFTVTANEEHFQAISNIVTDLILFSDPAHKTRLDKLETLLFTYDFTDLASSANVVVDLQGRLRNAMESKRKREDAERTAGNQTETLEALKLGAHIYLLTEELNLIFDAIKLVQDRFDDQTDQKSALLLHASSSEISWRMLDEQKDLLAKLAVRDIEYHWLSRQDSSTVNNLAVGDLQAFDGYPQAIWTEILSKYDEPSNHPLLKRGLFVLANWIVLAPVGGITIYEEFELSLHPMRLQIDTRVGSRIMAYLFPARRHRANEVEDGSNDAETHIFPEEPHSVSQSRSSLDSPRTLQFRKHTNTTQLGLAPPLRKLGASRSFNDLRTIGSESPLSLQPPHIRRNRSISPLRPLSPASQLESRPVKVKRDPGSRSLIHERKFGDAAEMKTRSSQKSFVYVKISSLNLLLSIMKEESFQCQDARIRTRDLEYRNQTWSFEELVNQFIPSDMSWKGWVKVALHQPLIPVLPVARELISKTRWRSATSKGGTYTIDSSGSAPKLLLPKAPKGEPRQSRLPGIPQALPTRRFRKSSLKRPETPSTSFTGVPLSTEPEPIDNDNQSRPRGRTRVLSLFSRTSSRSRKSTETANSTSALPPNS